MPVGEVRVNSYVNVFYSNFHKLYFRRFDFFVVLSIGF